jgi:4-hydroxy-3-polyprenylbenzoate decarboxylase
VFHLSAVTHRRNPIYPATVVGIPPMEDKFLGDATQLVLGPLVKLIHAEITDMWAYYEAGFHNLLVVAVDQRYSKEAMKTALGLMGMSQLSLTKSIVLVSEGVDVRDFDAVLREIREHYDPHYDFVMIPRVPLDTLDFTSMTMNLGSKMILDATRKPRPEDPGVMKKRNRARKTLPSLSSIDRRIVDQHLASGSLLLVKVTGGGRQVLKKLVAHEALQHVPLVAVVSDDVDLRDRENSIWGVFTRFDCERDVMFAEQKLIGICPVFHGVMGIDATWKKGYPEALSMTDEVRKKVDAIWPWS